MNLFIPSELPLAFGLEFVSDLGGSLLVMTGVLAGGFRSWAVLTELPQDRIEWMTALGFAVGVAATILSVVVEQIWR